MDYFMCKDCGFGCMFSSFSVFLSAIDFFNRDLSAMSGIMP